MAERFAFEEFVLDPNNHHLRRGTDDVELNGRYFDALALLVREHGKLISKDRFLEEVWRGVPVTDEALTQCVRTIRRQLGDNASQPRFIETVPKHGYRFIASVSPAEDLALRPAAPQARPRGTAWIIGVAGTIGGVIAGFIGGLLYGFLGASQPLQPGMGAASVLLVLLSLTDPCRFSWRRRCFLRHRPRRHTGALRGPLSGGSSTRRPDCRRIYQAARA